MYQPSLREDQIRALYHLKHLRRLPMTALLREAVDNYFSPLGGTHAVIPEEPARDDSCLDSWRSSTVGLQDS